MLTQLLGKSVIRTSNRKRRASWAKGGIYELGQNEAPFASLCGE